MLKYDQSEKVDKDSVDNVNGNVNDMIAFNIILSKIIVKCKADIGHGAIWVWAFKPSIV
jgi:hypothetical protein